MNISLAVMELALNPRFKAVMERCLDEEELIVQFERLSGIKRPPTRGNPLEAMVDIATGFRDAQWKVFFEAFIPFVYDCIWLRWADRDNEEFWQTPNEHHKD
ncbi:hypothetical protein SMZ63_002783 [Cronobacter sakazakii]|nr:hypothetical protein [Cronobacter sakazakii]ELY4456209.1 hypothetical protein [Cronobacter sakazakii]ELY4597327.1 hypothetical protein [Cronobacter sakazakii]